MTGVLETWARHLAAARHGGPPDLPVTGHGHRLVGGPVPLDRLGIVPASTVALLLVPGRPVEVRTPGTVLAPTLLAPVATQPVVLVVLTGPARLQVTVPGGTTFDGRALDEVTLRLRVLLDPRDGLVALRRLVAEHGTGLEAGLLAAVQREASAAVRGAVRMNRLADLRRLSLAEVLRSRWWPATFADGALVCTELEVRHVRWPDESTDEPTVPLPLGAW